MAETIRIQQITDSLTGLMNREIAANLSSCVSCAVVQNGNTLWKKTVGYADMASHKPAEDDTIFRIYSMTKPVTAVAAHILLERGLLDYYDPVGRYLPAFADMQVYTDKGIVRAKRELRIIDLLSMTSGLVYPAEDPAGTETEKLVQQLCSSGQACANMTLWQFCEKLADIPLAFQPGERWRYGLGADVMGAVIEAVSGKSLRSFFKEEILEPLQMTDTDFYVPKEKRERLATLYEQKEKGSLLEEKENCYLGIMDYQKPPVFESAGAGLFSTLNDYSKFASMLANDGVYGDVRILGRKTVELLSSNQLENEVKKTIDFEQIKGHGYGNFMRVYENLSAYGSSGNLGEFGWDGWTGPYLSADRKEKLAIVMMRQTAGYNHPEMIRRYRNIIYGVL